MNKTFIQFALFFIILLAGGFAILNKRNSSPPKREEGISQEAVATVNINNTGTEAMPENGAGKYVDYSPETITQAKSAGGKTVLFFHAKWCLFCRAAEADILANKNKIPEDVTILKVDYDSAKDLRQKFGITTQHTFVQIDKDGRELGKWVGGDTLSEITGRLL